MEGIHKVPYVASMDVSQLETWYDETYQLMLLCILENEYKKSAKQRFKQLRVEKEKYKEELQEA